jgi:dipeptidyl-peptidase-4
MRGVLSSEELILMRAAALIFSAALLPSFAVSPIAAQSAANQPVKPLTVEAIFAPEPLTGEPPDTMTWSPDGKHLSYLDGGELIDLDPETAKSHVLVSRAKLASISGTTGSETDRDHRARYKMADYQWAPDSSHLMFDSNGRLWVYDLKTGTGVQIGFTGAASGDDPKFSPSGELVSYVRDHGLVVTRLRDSSYSTLVVAPSPNPATFNGEVDWVYEEELETRTNYVWSPDSRAIAYLQMNEADVPMYPIEDWLPTHATVEMQRYPQAGDPNPDVRVGVVSAQGSKTSWIRLPIKPGQDYIPRFGWVDHKTLWIETLSRDHKHRNIYFADIPTGHAHSVLEITDEKFLDDNYDVTVDDGFIVLTNWTDGHNHIYLYSYERKNSDTGTAKLEKQLTQGDFDVSSIARVDIAKRIVYFTSNEGNLLDRQFWQVGFDGQRKQLTASPGSHEANLSPVNGNFADVYSTRMDPPAVSLCNAGRSCTVFWQSHALEAYHLRPPEQIEVKAHDGTTLYATLLLPEGATAPASVPLIVNPYGGPGPQEVVNHWNSSLLFDELLAQHGFAVLHADNRGTGMRGRAFAQFAYHNFGPVQFEDQLTVVDDVLSRYPQLDKQRLGWWGWSWGGTFTLYTLTHSDRFRAGVAVAPVTDWRNYDSIYTERYMSQPSEFADGYKDFSVVNSAAALKGHLLLVHGTGDDNVHIENSVQFIQKLIEADVTYDFQIYPRKTHSIAGSDVRTHLFNRILAQFERYLKPPVASGAGQ